MSKISRTAIQSLLDALKKKNKTGKFVGLSSAIAWEGPEQEPGNSVGIFQCNSQLRMRELLSEPPAPLEQVVLVTQLGEKEIPDDIRARLVGCQFYKIRHWEIVEEAFQARETDGRIKRKPELAEAMTAFLGGLPIPSARQLDAECFWGVLLERALKLKTARPALAELLSWMLQPESYDLWRHPEIVKIHPHILGWLDEVTGPAAGYLLKLFSGPRRNELMAIGLIWEVLFHPELKTTPARAIGRLESLSDLPAPSSQILDAWKTAMVEVLDRQRSADRHRISDQADELAQRLEISELLFLSNALQTGLDQRLERLGQQLTVFLKDPTPTHRGSLKAARDLALEHRSLRYEKIDHTDKKTEERIHMAMRLAYWVTQPSKSAGHLAEAARTFMDESSWVDSARDPLYGTSEHTWSESLNLLLAQVTQRREEENRRFAELLCQSQGQAVPDAGLIPVEDVLSAIAPLLRAQEDPRILLLVLDGMSYGVFRSIQKLLAKGWIELGLRKYASHPNRGQRLQALSTIPSVTQYARTSLLTGKLQSGSAETESRDLPQHPTFKGLISEVFHKSDIHEMSGLAQRLQSAIQGDANVVTIVLNAIDDHLDRGHQLVIDWSEGPIRGFNDLLVQARQQNRALVLVSDHGHVLERGTHLLPADEGDGERYATSRGHEAGPDEMLISGPRVLTKSPTRVIWSEQARYGKHKYGYHGGISPQEMLVPVSIWVTSPMDKELAGDDESGSKKRDFVRLPADTPDWWSHPFPSDAPSEVPSVAVRAAVPTTTLFDLSNQDKRNPIDEILESKAMKLQRQLNPRVRIDVAELHEVIKTFQARGGTMTLPALASATRQPEHRISGYVSQLAQLLNVDGYAVIERDDVTVRLNWELLVRQMGGGK